MLRGPLYRDGYNPQLSGHETFPIRYGWLKKAFDAVRDTEDQDDNRQVFSGPDAIARFGVGKNMVSSMRHWATAAGIIADDPNRRHISTTSLGDLLFGPRGIDPYMEHPGHHLAEYTGSCCGRDTKTTVVLGFPSLSISFLRAGVFGSEGSKGSPKNGDGPARPLPPYGGTFPASSAATSRRRPQARATLRTA